MGVGSVIGLLSNSNTASSTGGQKQVGGGTSNLNVSSAISNQLNRQVKDKKKRAIFNVLDPSGALANTFGFAGGGDEEEEEALPFFENPNFNETQEFLKTLGIDILGGDVPDYFRAIGETGSQEFEDVLGLAKRDVGRSILDSAAITGRGRGGGVQSQIAEELSDLSIEARFKDFERSLGGKQFLFQQGRGITEGVRSAAFNREAAVNNFNIGTATRALEAERYDAAKNEQAAGATGKLVGQGVGAVLDFFKKKKGTDVPTTTTGSGRVSSNLGGIVIA